MTQPINIRPEADLVAAIVQHARKAGFTGIAKLYDTPSRSASRKALRTLKCHVKTLRLAASPEAALAATALQELIQRRTRPAVKPECPESKDGKHHASTEDMGANPNTYCKHCDEII